MAGLPNNREGFKPAPQHLEGSAGGEELEGLEGRPRSSRIVDSGFFAGEARTRAAGGRGRAAEKGQAGMQTQSPVRPWPCRVPPARTVDKLGFPTSQFLHLQNREDSQSLPGAAGTEQSLDHTRPKTGPDRGHHCCFPCSCVSRLHPTALCSPPVGDGRALDYESTLPGDSF